MINETPNTTQPWFERTDAQELVETLDIPENLLNNVNQMIDEGYTILDISEGNSDTIDDINDSIDLLIQSKSFKKNPDYYHYNDSPRIIEAWKKIDSISKISNDSRVIDFLVLLYQKKPLPFSTINFTKSTEQPIHSDYIHFGSLPERYLAAAWVALQDIHQDSCPLNIIPKSHKDPIITLKDFDVKIPKNLIELKKNYNVYEAYLGDKIKESGRKILSPKLDKGQCLIWSANLYHGAPLIKNKTLLRKSMVTHYHFSECEYYNPGFSDIESGRYAYRELEIVK